MKTFYIASKVIHAPRWRELRDVYHLPINSSWIDEAGLNESKSYRELSERCVNEISQCSFVLLFCEFGEMLKGALIEAGIALALKKRVKCVGTCESLSRVFAEHPLWEKFDTIEEATKELV